MIDAPTLEQAFIGIAFIIFVVSVCWWVTGEIQKKWRGE